MAPRDPALPAATGRSLGLLVNLLLAFLLSSVLLGLVTSRLDRWTYLTVVSGSIGVTMLYFGLQRFWT
jgi:hypothetical protein